MHNNIDYPIKEKESYRVPFVYGCSKTGLVFPGAHKNEIISMRNIEEACMDMHFAENKTYKRIFIKGSDALLRNEEELVKLLKVIKEEFKDVEAISLYAMPSSVLERDMEKLKKAGLTSVYLGIAPAEGLKILDVFAFDSRKEEKEAVKKLQAAGLTVYVSFAAGYMADRQDVVNHLRDMNIAGIEIRRPRTANVVPLPPGKAMDETNFPENSKIEKDVEMIQEGLGVSVWIENL